MFYLFDWFIGFRRAVLVRESDKPGGEPVDITPKGYSVRTTAQEYGGGAFSISGGTIIFSNCTDQRLYKQFVGSGGKFRLLMLLLSKIKSLF